MNRNANQMKYGLIKAANFTKDQRNHGQKKNAIEMYYAHNEGKSVKNLLEPQRTKFISI